MNIVLRNELTSLDDMLHLAALKARDEIEAIPADVGVEAECAAIDAAGAPVFDLAERILALPAHGKAELGISALAAAWIDGTYWMKGRALK